MTHWHISRRLAVVISLLCMLLTACSNSSGTSSTALGTATVAPTTTTDATTTPTVGAGTPTSTLTPTTTPAPGGATPTATASQPKTVIYGFTSPDVFTAFDVVTRAHIWHRDLGSTPNQPIYANGLLYVYGEPYNLEAYDPHTGAHVWQAPYFSEAPLTVTSTLVYNLGFVSSSGTTFTYTLTALNAHTGAVTWHQTTTAQSASYLLSGGVIYMEGLQSATTLTIYAFDAETGAPKATYTIPTPSSSAIAAISNGIMYFACSNVDLCAANLATQTIIWKFHTGGVSGSQLTIANGIVYFGTDDNYLYAVNAATGAMSWSYKTGGSVQSKPIVVSGNAYFSSTDGHYYGLNSSGQLLWRALIDGGNHDSGQWYNGQIYFPDNTVSAGVVCIINPTTGKLTQLIYIPAAPFVVAAW